MLPPWCGPNEGDRYFWERGGWPFRFGLGVPGSCRRDPTASMREVEEGDSHAGLPAADLLGFGERSRPRAGHDRLHGENAGEEVGEQTEGDEPYAHDHEYVASPPLDRGSARPDPFGHALLGEGDRARRRERQQNDRAGRHDVGGERGLEPSRGERLPRQTGEDPPRPPQADDEGGETEGGEPRHGMPPAEARLPLQQGL